MLLFQYCSRQQDYEWRAHQSKNENLTASVLLGCMRYRCVSTRVSSTGLKDLVELFFQSTKTSVVQEACFAVKFLAHKLPCAFGFYVSSAGQVTTHLEYWRKPMALCSFSCITSCLYFNFFRRTLLYQGNAAQSDISTNTHCQLGFCITYRSEVEGERFCWPEWSFFYISATFA